jgi:hypothetical protein
MSRIRDNIRFGGVPNPREATVMKPLNEMKLRLHLPPSTRAA